MFHKNIPIDDTACLIPPYDGRIPVLPSLTANLNQKKNNYNSYKY